MISTLKICVNAAHPNLKLQPIISFINSPSNIRIIDVPKKIGKWAITEVFLQVVYPDQTTRNVACVLTGGAWVGTITGSTLTGKVQSGYGIVANGTDENGEPVTGYVLGRGDVVIYQNSMAIEPGTITNFMRLVEFQTDNPLKGDFYLDGSVGYVYDGTEWIKMGGDELSVATADKLGGIKATERFITLDDTGDIVSLNASHADSAYQSEVASEALYAKKVDDETEGLSAYVKKTDLKKPVFSCTFINNQTNDINQKVTIYKFLRVGEMTIQQQIKYISVSVKAKSQQKFYTEMTDDTEGVSLALGDVYMTYTDTTGKQKSVYKVRAIDSTTYADVDWTKDIVATSINGVIDVGVTKITAGNNVTISPTSGTGNVTINANIPSLSAYAEKSYVDNALSSKSDKPVEVESDEEGQKFFDGGLMSLGNDGVIRTSRYYPLKSVQEEFSLVYSQINGKADKSELSAKADKPAIEEDQDKVKKGGIAVVNENGDLKYHSEITIESLGGGSVSVATDTNAGTIKATTKYMDVAVDGTITRLDADYSPWADECENASYANHANWADNATNSDFATQADDLTETGFMVVGQYVAQHLEDVKILTIHQNYSVDDTNYTFTWYDNYGYQTTIYSNSESLSEGNFCYCIPAHIINRISFEGVNGIKYYISNGDFRTESYSYEWFDIDNSDFSDGSISMYLGAS